MPTLDFDPAVSWVAGGDVLWLGVWGSQHCSRVKVPSYAVPSSYRVGVGTRKDGGCYASMGHKLAHEVPTAALHVLAECKHSAQLEKPLHCADAIRRFSVAGNPLALDFSSGRHRTARRGNGASGLTSAR